MEAPRRAASSVALSALAAGALSGACTSFLRSDDATFGPPGSEKETRVAVPACEGVGEPLYLKASNPTSSAWFGFTLAAQGSTLVALAPLEKGRPPVDEGTPGACLSVTVPDNILGAGALRVFEHGPSGLQEQLLPIERATLVRPRLPEDSPGVFAYLNVSTFHVALDGDLLALGVAGDGAIEEFRGSVRVFRREGGRWGPEALRIDEPESKLADLFGMSVAVSKDVLVVGAPSSDGQYRDSGTVHVYELSGSTYSHRTRLDPPVRQLSGWFGSTLALSTNWLVVGSTGGDGVTETPEGSPLDFAGGVFAYRRLGASLDTMAVRIPTPHLRAAGVGAALALDDELLVVSAPFAGGCTDEVPEEFQARTRTTPPGAVYLFEPGTEGGADDWRLTGCLEPGGQETGVFFGLALALTNRFLAVAFAGADGRSRGVQRYGLPPLGAGEKDQFTGSVRLYPRDSRGRISAEAYCVVKASNTDNCDVFGNGLAATDDFLAVGAPAEDGEAGGAAALDETNGLLNAGATYVYPLEPAPVR